jgi:hypothetical protein
VVEAQVEIVYDAVFVAVGISNCNNPSYKNELESFLFILFARCRKAPDKGVRGYGFLEESRSRPLIEETPSKKKRAGRDASP